MEFHGDVPIYLQIVNNIKANITSGKWELGMRMPSQRDYAKEMKVNPNTISKVYQELERLEIVETLRGVGTFIVNDEAFIARLKFEELEKMVVDIATEVKQKGYDIEKFMEALREELEK
ncbi:MAG: GntR family transcriptional regulator [Eubacteriales bacterium]|nr:GntR family transcriptional regulator [Eubacteriales bacterium]MDY3333175.1 GntR family transcriptional regulator [Gallibacter sp.]